MENRSPPLLSRFFGGPPLWVLIRLVLLSILVGFVLSAFGLDPLNIVYSVRRLLQNVWDLGFDAVKWLWGYFLLGAVLVIPIWFLARLLRSGQRRLPPPQP